MVQRHNSRNLPRSKRTKQRSRKRGAKQFGEREKNMHGTLGEKRCVLATVLNVGDFVEYARCSISAVHPAIAAVLSVPYMIRVALTDIQTLLPHLQQLYSSTSRSISNDPAEHLGGVVLQPTARQTNNSRRKRACNFGSSQHVAYAFKNTGVCSADAFGITSILSGNMGSPSELAKSSAVDCQYDIVNAFRSYATSPISTN